MEAKYCSDVGVSVLMTTFNGGRYLHQAIESVFSQKFHNWELILLDNASTDGSVEKLNISDPRIKLESVRENIGRTKGLQSCLERATQEYCAILDADDIALPKRFALQAEFLYKNPSAVLVGSRIKKIFADLQLSEIPNQISGRITHDMLAERNPFVNSSVMFRRSTAISVGGYDSSFEFAQDYDFFIRIASKGELFVLDEVLTELRIHDLSFSKQKHGRLLRAGDEVRLFELAADRLILSRRGAFLNRRRQAISNLELATYEIRAGLIARGATRISKAIRQDPKFSWVTYLIRGRKNPFQ